MTNEDALNGILRKAFPSMVFVRSINYENQTQAIHFSEEWLNNEYKDESNDVDFLRMVEEIYKYRWW